MLQRAILKGDRKSIIIPIVLIIAFILSLSFILISIIYLLFPNARDDNIRRLNICAEQIYNQLNSAQDGTISIPDDYTVIAGEFGNTYMLIYANPYIGDENQYLYGEESDDNHIFWAAKINGKKIERAWCSEHLLSENEMHEYSYEQKK